MVPFTRLPLLWLSAWLPFPALGALIAGWQGAGATGAIGAFWVTWVALRADTRLAARHAAKGVTVPELVSSLKRTAEINRHSGALPEIHSYPDPHPGAWVARAPGSREAMVFVSQGGLQSWKETELREVLSAALARAKDPTLSVQTFAAELCCIALSGKARPWAESWILGRKHLTEKGADLPGFVCFLMALPWCRFWLRVAGAARAPLSVAASRRTASKIQWNSTQPGALGLYLSGPGLERNVLSPSFWPR